MEVCYHTLVARIPETVTPETVANREEYQELCRQHVERIIGQLITELPRESTEDGIMGVLDPVANAIVKLPRERRIPEPKAETKWERFAKEKGIKKKKKGLLVYDEAAGNYKMRYGRYSLKNAEREREAIIEDGQWAVKKGKADRVPVTAGRATAEAHAAGVADPFELRDKLRELEKSKNKLKNIQNLVKGAGYKLKDTPDRVVKQRAPKGKKASKRAARKQH